jgi:hypothetical protein
VRQKNNVGLDYIYLCVRVFVSLSLSVGLYANEDPLCACVCDVADWGERRVPQDDGLFPDIVLLFLHIGRLHWSHVGPEYAVPTTNTHTRTHTHAHTRAHTHARTRSKCFCLSISLSLCCRLGVWTWVCVGVTGLTHPAVVVCAAGAVGYASTRLFVRHIYTNVKID